MRLRYVIYGAGGIGGVIGARLFQAGQEVTLIARGEHARVMSAQGLRLIAPNEQLTFQMPVVEHPAAARIDHQTVVLLCMKSQHTLSALEDLAGCASPDTPVVCVQNGVANERQALRFFKHVYATVVNLPALYLTPGEVVSFAQGQGGILDSGCYPGGVDELSDRLTKDLSSAGFSSMADPRVMRKKYAKLLLNLNNVLLAGVKDFENTQHLRQLILQEALACYDAARIQCASKEDVKARQNGVYQMAKIPGYENSAGSSWQSVMRGTGDIETEYLNGEISLLGRLHGVATPANDACVGLARQLMRSKSGPGIVTAATLLATLQNA